jgi:hypothetical protein
MKPNALFPILFTQNNLKKKSGTDIFYQIIAHVHFREILSDYFLFSRFVWSIFVTQLVAKHMKEIIIIKIIFRAFSCKKDFKKPTSHCRLSNDFRLIPATFHCLINH